MPADIIGIAKVLMAIYSVSFVGTILYRLYLHPLSNFSGPKSWIAFPLLRQIAHIRGLLDARMCDFHRIYGPVVRFGPGEVSFITEDAWRDIYDHKPNQLQRFILPTARRPDIFDAEEADHDRYRKAMSHAFSPRGLLQQEPVVNGYIDMLMGRLHEQAARGASVDMTMWYTLTLFDVIGDLAFGQSFGGLRDQVLHSTISFTFEAFKLLTFLEAGASFPILFKLLQLCIPKRLIEARDRKEKHAEETVRRRMADESLHGRGDFMDSMMRHDGTPQGLNTRELIANASTLITAGSETTSTILSGVTFYLLCNIDAMKKVVNEVRSAYSSESEIAMSTTAQRLPYMSACFLEAFRLYPPVPSGLQRMVPSEGRTRVSSYDIPPNTKVSVHPLAAYNDARNWHKPELFLPERWLPEAKSDPSSLFYNDCRNVCQPFSVGPRSCPGRNMAEQEYRLILARILWNFDLELCPESKNWTEQRTHYLWEKKPLMCRLNPRPAVA
ncbi:Cytochrome P450 CYP65T7 [Beauveria bassiana ARSEF 2860]|uniref:Cytochrome P450 CYP65T7 n=1 Tax=Beauveria bassiana (strain ARSEF 2860) TaxID=655819 RepID=J4VV82_BEAB2|nr:Cytochrome P450 CYP65T7 [Beauveria bassiana ARSEF 2860]EJP62380.1 Cytochrome P450 CYP65T7 [Beauveria bassiana ARSEF 2860]